MSNTLLNLINHQRGIDKIYLYVKDPYQPLYQYLIKKREEVDLTCFCDQRLPWNTQMIRMMSKEVFEKYKPGKKQLIIHLTLNLITEM